MKRIFWVALLVPLVSGCFGVAHYSVTGASGKLYTAPDICQALVQCQNSAETACFYPDVKTTSQDGKSYDQSYCKEVKK